MVIVLLVMFMPFILLIQGFEKLEMQQHLPNSVRQYLTLVREEKSVFQDAFYLYVYSVDEEALDDVYDTLLNKNNWQELPMSERECEVYLEKCCAWSISFLTDEFINYVTTENSDGLWKYAGSIDDEVLCEGGRISVDGWHKMFLFMPEEAKLIYIDVDY